MWCAPAPHGDCTTHTNALLRGRAVRALLCCGPILPHARLLWRPSAAPARDDNVVRVTVEERDGLLQRRVQVADGRPDVERVAAGGAGKRRGAAWARPNRTAMHHDSCSSGVFPVYSHARARATRAMIFKIRRAPPHRRFQFKPVNVNCCDKSIPNRIQEGTYESMERFYTSGIYSFLPFVISCTDLCRDRVGASLTAEEGEQSRPKRNSPVFGPTSTSRPPSGYPGPRTQRAWRSRYT